MRMRKIHLAVDHARAVVFWAPKQKTKQLFYKYPWKFDKFFVHYTQDKLPVGELVFNPILE